jgi:hypothetical protein
LTSGAPALSASSTRIVAPELDHGHRARRIGCSEQVLGLRVIDLFDLARHDHEVQTDLASQLDHLRTAGRDMHSQAGFTRSRARLERPKCL